MIRRWFQRSLETSLKPKVVHDAANDSFDVKSVVVNLLPSHSQTLWILWTCYWMVVLVSDIWNATIYNVYR